MAWLLWARLALLAALLALVTACVWVGYRTREE